MNAASVTGTKPRKSIEPSFDSRARSRSDSIEPIASEVVVYTKPISIVSLDDDYDKKYPYRSSSVDVRESEIVISKIPTLEEIQLKSDIWAARVWRRLPIGMRIQTMTRNYYTPVKIMAYDLFPQIDQLYRLCCINDDSQSALSFLKTLESNLNNNISLIVIDEKKEKEDDRLEDSIAAFLVLTVMSESECSLQTLQHNIYEGEAMIKYMECINFLFKQADIVDLYECSSYLRISDICINPTYRHLGLTQELLLSAVQVARSFKINVIMGIFSPSMKKIAEKVFMKVLYAQDLGLWLNKKGELHFEDDIECGESSYYLMAGLLPEKPPLEDPNRPPKKPGKK